MNCRLKLLLFVAVLLAGCAQPVFNVEGTAAGLTPALATADIRAAAGRRVVWGGVLVEVSNLARTSELEILAYPLDRSQRPQRERPPIGRFIAVYPGYLEPVEFAPGSLVTVIGEIQGLDTRPVGEARYTYPVVAARGVHLWDPKRPDGNFHIGVGIGIFGD